MIKQLLLFGAGLGIAYFIFKKKNQYGLEIRDFETTNTSPTFPIGFVKAKIFNNYPDDRLASLEVQDQAGNIVPGTEVLGSIAQEPQYLDYGEPLLEGDYSLVANSRETINKFNP